MNEAETCDNLITPVLTAAGWGVEGSRIHREFGINKGRLQGAGGKRGARLKADYVLVCDNRKLAVLEAKRRSAGVTEGLGQAKEYARLLQVPFAYATNGDGLYEVDMTTGAEGALGGMAAFPSPQELSERARNQRNNAGEVSDASETEWLDRFDAVPFKIRGDWETRYYQDNAIDAVMSAIARGRERILLTLATGTGKTAIAFQIAWKLFHSRWNLNREADRRPRILFLADRNILADQAYNSFSAFAEDARVRVSPDEIKKKGGVPRNASIFFTIFQTFMSGPEDTPYFGDYAPDFFDFIMIDECHRGGANEESSWRDILEHFSPAVQLGLTATPKRKNNVDTYDYFGRPVYEYSLKAGINDGFLTPFRVRPFASSMDDYTYHEDDEVIQGAVEEGRTYTGGDFNTASGLVIPDRERERVREFMDEITGDEKTLVFCAGQAHALMVRDMVNQYKTHPHADYCVRVTADESERGEEFLRIFQDSEKTIPAVLTTSTKLSTGVDARNVRNIVLLRPIKSMIEFKQIIGRGTRLYEGKDYFTIYDFVKAHEHFQDGEWDGEPLEPVDPSGNPRGNGDGLGEPDNPWNPDDPDNPHKPETVQTIIQLSDGRKNAIRHISTTVFFGPDNQPLSAAQFIGKLFGELPGLFRDEDELRSLWGQPDTRKALLAGLSERGYGEQELNEIRRIVQAEKSDLFDVLAWIACARKPLTRQARADNRRARIMDRYSPELAEFLDYVLDQYVKEGVGELDEEKLPGLIEARYETLEDGTRQLGNVAAIREAFTGFQQHLYE